VLGAALAILAVWFAGATIKDRHPATPPAVDLWWFEVIARHRVPALDSVALVVSWIGQGVVGFALIPLLLAAILFFSDRRRAALLLVASVTATLLASQLRKALIERPRPPDMLVPADPGSFPSAHVAVAATLTLALALVLRRSRVIPSGAMYTLLMILSRTYLNEHWLTDTVAGLILGAAIPVLLLSVGRLTTRHAPLASAGLHVSEIEERSR
jgi:membrane-associated phospholipid phosphatase